MYLVTFLFNVSKSFVFPASIYTVITRS